MPRTKRADTDARVGPRLVSKSVDAKSAQAGAVSHERIAFRAYEIFLQEGGGSDVDHWLRAERELLESQLPARPVRKAGTKAKG